MKKPTQKYRMPDGTYVKDAVKVSKAWHKISDPICKKFEVSVIGYDPGILFREGNSHFQVSTALATQLSQLINDNQKLKNLCKSLLFKT